MSLYNRPVNSSLPAQQVSYKVKFEKEKDQNGFTKWQKDSMDALESVGRYSFYNNIYSILRIHINNIKIC